MKISTFLAVKFLYGKRRGGLINGLTLVAFFGVVLSVMALVLVTAVMTGFKQDLQDKILGFSAHVTVTLKKDQDWRGFSDGLKARQELSFWSPYQEGEAVIRTTESETLGVKIRGIEADFQFSPKNFEVNFIEGEDAYSLVPKPGALPAILLGEELAHELAIVPVLSEQVELLYPFGEVGPTGEMLPQVRAYRVVGTFRSGYYDYDSKFALVDFSEARALFGDTVPVRLGLYLQDPHRTEGLVNSLEQLVGVESVSPWQQVHARLFSALKLERIGMGLVLGLMLTLSTFNTVSLFMMVVYERRQEIAVLRALGMSEGSISAIFLRAGAMLGILGGALGVSLGVLIAWALKTSRLPLPAPYYIDSLPVVLHGAWLLVALLLAPTLCVLATVWPSREGRRLNLVEALRYE